jgi:hypothetical protein
MKKKKKQTKTQKEISPMREERLTLMAVQEKLGLFKNRQKLQDETEEHDYLKKKPLGLI